MIKNNEYIKRESKSAIECIEEKLEAIKQEFANDNIDYNYINSKCKIIKIELDLLVFLSKMEVL